jgi:hypothetical protein
MNPVLVRIGLSFFIAGVWIAFATVLGERLGSHKAGLIANLPSNILISMLFMGLTRGPEYAAAATAGVPMGMIVACIFLAVFIFLLRRGVWVALSFGLVSWVLSAFVVIVLLPPLGIVASLIAYFIVSTGLFILVHRWLGRPKVEKKPVALSWKIIAIRAFFAGTVVAGAVAIAQVAPPYMTGVLATFPAALSSTMVIISLSQGILFAQATGKIILLSSTNIIVYAALVALSFPVLGPWLGTLLSLAGALGFILILGKISIRFS